ncbi:MAG: caspase family protein [Pseudomonadota bacterium]
MAISRFLHALLLPLVLVALPTAISAKNVALVIGNALYTESVSRLENPTNDALDIADAFKEQGYEVVTALDLGQRAMQAKLNEFRNIADTAEIAVVYYAGHGIEIGGRNFLVPVDARLSDVRDARLELIDINIVLDQISGASKLRMLVLDACRDNPFIAKMQQFGANRNVGRGLGRILDAGSNTLIAFAAAAGEVTPDGAPGGNSPFTAAFLEAMRGPAVDVRRLLGQVHDEMQRRVFGSRPAIYGSLGGARIVINPLNEVRFEPEPQAPAPDTGAGLMTAFLAADALGTLQAWDDFLALHSAQKDNAVYQLALKKREELLRAQAAAAEAAAAERARVQAELEALRAEVAETARIREEKAAAEAKLEELRAQAAAAARAVREKEAAEAALAALQATQEDPGSGDAADAQPAPSTQVGEVATVVAPTEPVVPAAPDPVPTAAERALVRDSAIRALQQVLKERNCYRGRIDGLVGPGTRGGVDTLGRQIGIADRVTSASPTEGFEALLTAFKAAPDARCPTAVAKPSTPKPRRTARAQQSAPAPVAAAPAAPAAPAPETSAKRDYKDETGAHCEWFMRGNVCE